MSRAPRQSAWLRAACGVALLIAVACGSNAPPAPQNLLLLTLDCTRADALGVYGGNAATPHLDALAAESVVFEQAITTAPYTGPSHASLLTGLYPPQHGLRDFLKQRLPQDAVTLAELLKGAQYETGAFVSAYVLFRGYGLAQGFDVYGARPFDPQSGKSKPGGGLFFSRRADNTVDEALHWLRARKPDQRWFAWLHFYDPHAPYEPPEGYRPTDAEPSPRALYQGEVAFMDAQIGRLLAELRRMDRYEDLLIAVVADHGELLGENGRRAGTHSPELVDETLHVPLLLRAPGREKPRRVAAQVRILDLFPTLLEAAHLAAPEGIAGQTLFGMGPESTDRPAYSETFYEFYPTRAEEGSELRSLRVPPWKWLTRPGRGELFDLRADPNELVDLADQHPERVEEMRGALLALRRDWVRPDGARLELTDEEFETHLERLRELGYVE